MMWTLQGKGEQDFFRSRDLRERHYLLPGFKRSVAEHGALVSPVSERAARIRAGTLLPIPVAVTHSSWPETEPNNLPRLWWICVGVAGCLPSHAVLLIWW